MPKPYPNTLRHMFIDQYHKFELHCTLFTLQKSSITLNVRTRAKLVLVVRPAVCLKTGAFRTRNVTVKALATSQN